MTQEEFEKQRDAVAAERQSEIKALVDQRIATMNTHHIEIGDTIECDNTVIVVDAIKYVQDFTGEEKDYLRFVGRICPRSQKQNVCTEKYDAWWREGSPLKIVKKHK